MNNKDFCIEDLLPHRGPMKLIREIIEIDTEKALTSSVVTETWPMVEEDGVLSLIIIELVAQTAGVCNGLDINLTEGANAPKLGWLVGIKKASFSMDVIPMGTEIITFAENSYKFENFREINGVSKVGDNVVGEVVLQLLRADQEIEGTT